MKYTIEEIKAALNMAISDFEKTDTSFMNDYMKGHHDGMLLAFKQILTDIEILEEPEML